ncbi:hypothetical protein GCM10007967_15410 [Xylanimonas ulmi]
MRWYSSGLRPSSANGCASSGVAAAFSTVSRVGRAVEAAVIKLLEVARCQGRVSSAARVCGGSGVGHGGCGARDARAQSIRAVRAHGPTVATGLPAPSPAPARARADPVAVAGVGALGHREVCA